MKAVMRLRTALLATSAGACAGGLVLLALSGERASEAAPFVSANAAAAIAAPDSVRELGWDFALCQNTRRRSDDARHVPPGRNADRSTAGQEQCRLAGAGFCR